MADNGVVNLNDHRKSSDLFGAELRGKIEQNLEGYTEKPKEAAVSVEQAISHYFVTKVSAFAKDLGERFAKAVLK